MTMSASSAPPHAASTMARSSRRLGRKIPGVSRNTSWLDPSTTIPRTGMRVVCTLRETIVTFAPTSALTRVDLPAFGAPITAMKPHLLAASAASLGLASGSTIGGLLHCDVLLTACVSPHALAYEQGAGRRLLRLTLGGALSSGRFAAPDMHLGHET